MTRLLVLSSTLAALAFSAAAQTPDGPPRSEKDKPKGEWRSGGGMPGYGRPPGRNDGFDQLPEAEKKRVREALDKVWGRPEVIEARDRSMKANEDFRDAIRAALVAIDPEVVKIMDRVRPPDHFDPRQMPKLPPADSNEFPRVALQRLGMELVGFARPERREETKRMHERVIALPAIKTAFGKVETTSGEERIQAMQKLRDIYRAEIGREFQLARERRGPPESEPPKP